MKKLAQLGAFWALLAAAGAAGAIEVLKLGPGERITLDGRFDEAAWSRGAWYDRFWESFPQDKVPAKVRTEVRPGVRNPYGSRMPAWPTGRA